MEEDPMEDPLQDPFPEDPDNDPNEVNPNLMARYSINPVNPNLELQISDYSLSKFNSHISFGCGMIGGDRVTYFLATSRYGDLTLRQWNHACRAGAHVRTPRYSIISHGFADILWPGAGYGDAFIRVLVTSRVGKTFIKFIEELSDDVNTIAGLPFVSILNQFSIALYDAKTRYLTCPANELLIGDDNQLIVPFRYMEEQPEGVNWFEGDIAINGRGTYVAAVEGMFNLYAYHNLFDSVSENVNLQILRATLFRKPLFRRFFMTTVFPMSYGDGDSIAAALIGTVDALERDWYTNRSWRTLNYGRFVSEKLGNYVQPTVYWESDIIEGRWGRDWFAELEKYNRKRDVVLEAVHKFHKDPKRRRNCAMCFIIFERNILRHGIRRRLRSLSRGQLLKAFDDIKPGALMVFFIEVVMRDPSFLVLQR